MISSNVEPKPLHPDSSGPWVHKLHFENGCYCKPLTLFDHRSDKTYNWDVLVTGKADAYVCGKGW